MKNFGILLIFTLLFSLGCENNIPSEKKEITLPTTQKSEPINTEVKKTEVKNIESKIPLPSEEEGVNYWEYNNCSRAIPKATVPKENQFNGYKFELNPQQGYAQESMFLENDYKLDITNKGCNSIILTYSYFLPASDLDVSDANAVSEKVLELIEMTTKMSTPPIDIKNKIQPFQMAIDQIGPFEIGNEFILSEKGGKLKFSIEKLEAKNNKVFLAYYFSKDLE